jgi:hypothetical protein
MSKHIHVHVGGRKTRDTDKIAINKRQALLLFYQAGFVSEKQMSEANKLLSTLKMPSSGYYYPDEVRKLIEKNKGATSNDSEESEAYIKGNKDAMAGKPKDPAFNPGGTKKPAVCLQYAEGYQQGVGDKKRRTKDSFPTSISIRDRKYVSSGKLRKGDDGGQQAGFEELDPSGARTGRMIWLTTAGKVVNETRTK